MGWDLHPCGELKERRGSESGEAFSLVGRSVGTEGELQGLSDETAANGLWQAGQSETYTDCPYHSPVHRSLRDVSSSADRC